MGQLIPALAPFAWVIGPFFAIGFGGLAAALALWLGLSRIKMGEKRNFNTRQEGKGS